MPRQLTSVRPEVAEQFHRLLFGELSIAQLEQWIYASKPLEEDLAADDHLALLSLDYRRPGALHEARKIILKYVDLGAFETEKLRRILGDIIERNEHALGAVQACYDVYCHGYYFFDNLALGHGLAFLDCENIETLTPDKRDKILADAYPSILAEAQKILGWLDAGKVVPTGEEVEVGQFGYLDNRSDEEKKPTAYQRA